MAISERLAHCHDVGLDAVPQKAPESVAGAAQARLHFVGDEHAAGLVDCLTGFGRKPGGPVKMPSLEKTVSTSSAAGCRPCRRRSAMAARTPSAKRSPTWSHRLAQGCRRGNRAHVRAERREAPERRRGLAPSTRSRRGKRSA
jgi:hypothetical protein